MRPHAISPQLRKARRKLRLNVEFTAYDLELHERAVRQHASQIACLHSSVRRRKSCTESPNDTDNMHAGDCGNLPAMRIAARAHGTPPTTSDLGPLFTTS